MNNSISFKKVILLEFLLMLIIFYVYALYIYPNIKQACTKVDLCSQTISCDCVDYSCTCQYFDEDNKI
ncbi:MAG: hypothetical protein PHF21_04900 [Bacilli bacterium]|nr:hypothetical protein [Bacilli bacterium]